MSEPACVGLYRTVGNRAKKHKVVLYLGLNKDWKTIQLWRNGSKMRLALAEETPACADYRAARHRACALHYSGAKPASLAGLEADLRTLEFDEKTVAVFIAAARPYLP